MSPPAESIERPAKPLSVSVLINNYNYGRFVGEAIRSALSQTQPVQVVVVDDGSRDNSRAVISSFGDRIQAVFQDNAGQAAAMNAGFALATGDVVIFLDADDKLDPRVAAKVLEEWRAGTVLLQYPLHIIDAEGRHTGIYPDPPTLLSEGDVVPRLLETGSFGVNVTSGLAFLRSALSAEMPLPAAELPNAADGYMVRAVAFAGAVQRLDVPLGFYRQHGRNDSNVNAAAGGLAEGFRKKLRYVSNEFEFTRRFAAKHGLAATAKFEDRSADYLGYRLFLALTDPNETLQVREVLWRLLGKYVSARYSSDWAPKHKALAIILATAATISPTPIATQFVRWLHDPSTRPRLTRLIGRSRREHTGAA